MFFSFIQIEKLEGELSLLKYSSFNIQMVGKNLFIKLYNEKFELTKSLRTFMTLFIKGRHEIKIYNDIELCNLEVSMIDKLNR